MVASLRERSDLHPAGVGRVSLVRAVRIDAPRAVVAEILSEYELLALYEHKVVRSVVRGARGRGVEVAIQGRFGLVPYGGRLLFTPRAAGGFDSVLLEASRIVGFSGCFGIRPDGRGCIVTHVEQYRFRGGPFGRLLGAILRPFLAASMGKELRRLKRLAEDPALFAAARRGLAVRIQPDRRVPVWNPVRGRARPGGLPSSSRAGA